MFDAPERASECTSGGDFLDLEAEVAKVGSSLAGWSQSEEERLSPLGGRSAAVWVVKRRSRRWPLRAPLQSLSN
eukprot:CAMPEP_0114486830 /NCGR_PEP_ID=MMETSP0109-20121206/430_1 /TAXON_ID=29199 /ORGANISM="Chlorarachnion reptans, Strain CCCM449" /LENGTH=73 /DNA_ID=CAMNT_0001663031 /DNA_START=89 /DNA_END=310 /DNA_ORIENTATION=+